MTDTKGYIYFGIKTDDASITISDFERYLTIKPTKFEQMFERGHVPKSTNWRFSTDNLTNPYCYEEIEKLITTLAPYKEEFKQLKQHYPQLYMVLEVVLFLGDETPGLNFSKRVLQFVNELDAEIDCDIYNEK